jgi:hypothetical protein
MANVYEASPSPLSFRILANYPQYTFLLFFSQLALQHLLRGIPRFTKMIKIVKPPRGLDGSL